MAPRFNIPPLTRGLIAGLVVLSLLNAAARYRSWEVDKTTSLGSRQYYAPYITVIPGLSIAYPWVFVTATLAEQNVVGLIITGITVFYGGRYLERAWGSTEYLKFIALISVVPNVLAFLAYITLFVVTRNPGLSSTSISGGIAIQAGFLVSFKQLVPEHTVSLLRSLIRIRVKHFPAIFLLSNTISGIVIGTDTAAILSWLGFLTSWTYLRFYRVSPSLSSSATGGTGEGAGGATIRGDASDTFAFAYFWPDAVHAPVAKVCDLIWEALVALRVCTPFSAEDVDMGNEQAVARGEGGHLPSLLNVGGRGGARGQSRREEAERRRALALRALDQRLHAASVRPPPPVAQAGSVAGASSMLGQTDYRPDSPEKGAPKESHSEQVGEQPKEMVPSGPRDGGHNESR